MTEAGIENAGIADTTEENPATAGSFPGTLRILLLFGIFIVPFMSALEFFQPTTHNYTAYFAIFTFGSGALLLLLSRMRVKIDFAILFIAWVVLNTGLIRGRDLLLSDYAFFVYPFTAAGFYVTARYLMGEQDTVLFLRLLMLFAVVESILAMLQSYMAWPLFTEVIPQFYADERNYFAYLFPGVSRYVIQGTGTFEHFNGLGALLALTFPIAFSLWLSDRSNLMRLLSVAAIGGGIIATFSRGALLSAILATGILWASTRSKKAFLILVVGACLVSGLFMTTFSQYFAQTENLTVRTSTWDLAAEYAVIIPIR